MVHLVMGGYDYQGEDVLSAWESQELAEAEMARLVAITAEHGEDADLIDVHAGCDHYCVRAMEVGTA